MELLFSLVGDNTGSGFTETVGVPDTNGNLIGGVGIAAINAQLGTLADNGGVTQTHALLFGSPAIDTGNQNAVANVSGIPLSDQREATFRRVADSTIVSTLAHSSSILLHLVPSTVTGLSTRPTIPFGSTFLVPPQT